MAKAGFRYDTLLRVREMMEQQIARGLAEVRRDIDAAQRDRDAIAREQVRMIDEAAATAKARFSAAAVHAYFQYERRLARQAVERDADIAALKQLEEARRAELEDATKRRRVVERLRERHLLRAYREAVRKEQRMTDEAAVARAALRAREERLPR